VAVTQTRARREREMIWIEGSGVEGGRGERKVMGKEGEARGKEGKASGSKAMARLQSLE
jgi:hypothetical protein